jgi:hypothetical protein
MVSGAVIYEPSFIKIGSGIQKLIRGIHTQTATRYHKPTLFFQNKESRLKSRQSATGCNVTTLDALLLLRPMLST